MGRWNGIDFLIAIRDFFRFKNLGSCFLGIFSYLSLFICTIGDNFGNIVLKASEWIDLRCREDGLYNGTFDR